MSKGITFFRNRQQDTGRTYEIEIEDSARPSRIFIYSRKPLEEALLRSPRKPTGGSAKAEVDKINQALQQGEGGVIAYTYDENRERVLVIVPVHSKGRAVADSFGLLLPGHPSLRWEPLNKDGLYVPPGYQALIPVDKDAEDSLHRLQEAVRDLPPDLESLVLHAIRNPSLDLRVGRLEATVIKGATGPGAAQIRGAQSTDPWYKRWLKQPVPVWPVVAVALGLMLTVNSVLLYSILHFIGGSVAVPRMPFQPPVTRNQNTTPEQTILAVAQAVEAFRGKESDPLEKLSTLGHFSMVKAEEDVKRVLQYEGNERLLLALGLMKLEALRLEPAAAATTLLSAADGRTAVKDFYKKRLGDNPEIRPLLSVLACAAFNVPELPLSQGGTSAALPLGEAQQDCSAFTLDKAGPGLQQLLDFVQNYQHEES